MGKVMYGPAIKALILLILLVLFFFLCFWQVMIQYSERFTNTIKILQQAETIEVPTFTICSGWKKSKFKEYKISPTIFTLRPHPGSTNLPSNATVRNIFDETAFKLNKDFVIGLGINFYQRNLLNIGMNKIETENSIYNFEVKEIPTVTSGMCYAIVPIGMTMQPYEDTMLLLIAKNTTLENTEMTKVTIQISSNDSYNTIIHKINGMKNSILEKDFTSNSTSLAIYYTEETNEFIKKCSESPFFKCLAETFVGTEKFNCTKKCVPLVYDSLMDIVDHNVPKCTDPIEKDEYCMLGWVGYATASKLKSTCIKQCKFKGSTLETMEMEQNPLFPLGGAMNALSYPNSYKFSM